MSGGTRMYAVFDDLGIIGAGHTRPEAEQSAAITARSHICGDVRFAEMTPCMARHYSRFRRLPRDFEISKDGRICSRQERLAEFGY